MRPPRLHGFPYVGCQRYFLTICTFQRTRHFTSRDLVTAVWLQFTRTASEEQFALIAYCFMPDHLHVLAEGHAPSSDLKAFMATAKQRAAHAARPWIRGRLWQSGYFDRILREEDSAQEIARYILQNPIRAGLVTSARDYPFLGSEILSKDQLIESTSGRPYNAAARKGPPYGG